MKISVQTVLNLLHNIIQAVSPDLVHHLQRTTIICWYLAHRIGLSDNEIRQAWLAGMLHDIGSLSKGRTQLAPEGMTQYARQQGAAMMSDIRFLQPVAAMLEETLDEWPKSPVTPLVRLYWVIHMADDFELFLRTVDADIVIQREELITQFLATSKAWPDFLVTALQNAGQQDGFWFRLSNPFLPQVLQIISPLKNEMLDHHDFLEVCQLISKIVDKYSSFTRTHSTSVAHVAGKLAELYGYDREMQEKICIAGYLHDIGKLFIPLNILEKCGTLEPREYAQMKLHSYKTLVMINPIEELGDIVYWAANHHERLDGSGYPFRLQATSLDVPSRIMAVADVFTAMTENRPYRQGLAAEKTLTILQEEADNNRLDQDIVKLLQHNIEQVRPLVTLC